MKFIVAGLGSMGKRRIRCLLALGHLDIIGFDPREDRRVEAERLYGIKTVASITDDIVVECAGILISTPPDCHLEYLQLAVNRKKPAFVEASVILEGLSAISAAAKANGVPISPSCTLRFHPAVKDITRLVKGGALGKFTNFTYHSGQYLPDWHPWEDVRDFYVSKKETGGCREIVPFELTWLVDVVGFPKTVSGCFGKTMDVGADIDDTYVLAMTFQQGIGALLVDVVSRFAVRSFVLNMEQGQIVWRWDEGCVNVYDARDQRWIVYRQKEAEAAAGYNKNIIEDMYIEEVAAFVGTVTGTADFPNSLDDDIRVLEVLYELEQRAD